MNWNETEILITGGTGSLGKALVNLLFEKYKPKGVRIFSRDELKQFEMRNEFNQKHPNAPISFLIGDIRDRKRVELATKKTDLIISCAALKQVPSCEDNPLEAINTNIIGSQNILYAALENKVQKVMAISTDKSCYPVNLYGATKLCAEKLFIQGNTYSGGREPMFSCVRYGNVLGSRGSVVPLFRKQYEENKKVTITDPSMTRFWITLNQVSNFILESIDEMKGGEIFIPKMGSAHITTILEAVIPEKCDIEYTGIRPGEKLHEILITKEEGYHAYEQKNKYTIIGDGMLKNTFEYRSDTNKQQLDYRAIRRMLKNG